jgi:hypothetical protein
MKLRVVLAAPAVVSSVSVNLGKEALEKFIRGEKGKHERDEPLAKNVAQAQQTQFGRIGTGDDSDRARNGFEAVRGLGKDDKQEQPVDERFELSVTEMRDTSEAQMAFPSLEDDLDAPA